MSGYFSSVLRQVSNRRPDTLISSFSSSGRRLSFGMGGAGNGLLAMGTHPMAAARAKGNQAATEAMLCGGMLLVGASAGATLNNQIAGLHTGTGDASLWYPPICTCFPFIRNTYRNTALQKSLYTIDTQHNTKKLCRQGREADSRARCSTTERVCASKPLVPCAHRSP